MLASHPAAIPTSGVSHDCAKACSNSRLYLPGAVFVQSELARIASVARCDLLAGVSGKPAASFLIRRFQLVERSTPPELDPKA